MLLKLPTSVLLFLSFLGCSSPSADTKSVAQTIPITMANLRGHKSLYNEGWFVLTSSRDALSFAKEHAIDNASSALLRAVKNLGYDAKGFVNDLGGTVENSLEATRVVYGIGSGITQNILSSSKELAKKELSYSALIASKAWQSLIKGNLSLGKRTLDDRKSLLNIAPKYFENLKKDFSNLGEIASSLGSSGNGKFSKLWTDAFVDAKQGFMDSYEKSGESENSLMALFHILFGYTKATYHGFLKPVTTSSAAGTYIIGEKLMKLAYLPIGATISVVGRSVESLGMSLYYTSKLGIKVVSPTVEAGFLSALSLLSLSGAALTSVTGKGLGLVNQLGTLVAAPASGVVYAGVSSAIDTAKLVTFVSYDLALGTAKVLFNEASAGVVLGYNALLAIPTHLLLASSDSVFFLAWDGPRLVIAAAKGKVHTRNISRLPVGSVVDLSTLEKNINVEVKIISIDHKLIEKVLHTLPLDTRIK